MSVISDAVDKVRGAVNSLGEGAAQALPKSWRSGGVTALRYGVASMGGGMGIQYEYSRNKGMNSNEAFKNSITGGYNYEGVRGEQKQREALENAKIILAQQVQAEQNQAVLDERAAAFRAARRKQLAAASAASNATNLTGPSGLLGDASGGQAKTLLGA